MPCERGLGAAKYRMLRKPNAPWRHRAHEFEALERTFTLAGPLLHVDPEIEIRGIRLRDYYA